MQSGMIFDPASAANPNCSCVGGIIPAERRGIMGHIVRGNVLCSCTGAHGPTARRAQAIHVGELRPLWRRSA